MAISEPTLINQHIQTQLNRQRLKSLWIKIVIFVFSILVILFISLLSLSLLFGSGELGFREKVMATFHLSNEVRWYMRLHTNIHIGSRSGGFGENNDIGLYDPKTKTVFIASADEGLAFHEITHAWWAHQRELAPEKKEAIVRDTIKLSQMNDKKYEDAIASAKAMINARCNCPDLKNISSADDSHMFVSWIDGIWSRGITNWQKYFPEFMWQYFENFYETAALRT